jgi:hypothetical protein
MVRDKKIYKNFDHRSQWQQNPLTQLFSNLTMKTEVVGCHGQQVPVLAWSVFLNEQDRTTTWYQPYL